MKTIFLIISLFAFSFPVYAQRVYTPEEIQEGCTYNVLSFTEDVLKALNNKYSPNSIKKSIVTKDKASLILGQSLVDAIVSADKDSIELIMNTMIITCIKHIENNQKVKA